ncbi:MAG TPA: arginine repressor [Candidatus Fimadaptatus faecigallinarum]|uniref:Arginine repressor n=1 Tax=Candidatus Fimadaptatus faecigallinarum TaxID=2840814 RepID=A0A9D1LS48_9FIRM|nr:arginine repressor [Candidatus Fimadaptatus faecigallinarum]
MKSVRHAMILDVIESMDIETQEELADELRARGIVVTQATVSRDIKELRLLKVLSDNGGYKYATVDKAEKGLSERFIRIFSESTLSMQSAENLIVIKTLSGSANAAGEAVDSLRWSEIVGSLAGDNTLLVIVKDKEHVQSVMDKFNAMMKK